MTIQNYPPPPTPTPLFSHVACIWMDQNRMGFCCILKYKRTIEKSGAIPFSMMVETEKPITWLVESDGAIVTDSQQVCVMRSNKYVAQQGVDWSPRAFTCPWSCMGLLPAGRIIVKCDEKCG